jgi:hypothetical protein
LEPLPNLNQPPVKTHKNNPTTKGHNPQMELCPKTIKKKKRKFGVFGGFRILGKEKK